MKKELVDESIYLRVTTPLARYNDYDHVPLPILNYAADRGTRVHNFCRLYALDMLFASEVDNDCFEYVQAFVNFFDDHVIEVIETEKRLFCDELKIQGQIDLIAKVEGYDDPCIIDIKTSLNLHKTHHLQLAAYRYLCSENKIKVSNRLILQLKKDGSYVLKDLDISLTTYFVDINIYTAILTSHRYFFD